MKQIPHKCPVCEGEGVRMKCMKWVNGKIETEEQDCRACDGKGIVWGWESAEPQYPPVPYYGLWWGIYPPVRIPSQWSDVSSGSITVSGDSRDVVFYNTNDPDSWFTELSDNILTTTPCS